MRRTDRFPDARPTVSDSVDELGGGRAQLIVAVLTGAVQFSMGSLVMMVTSLTDQLKLEWNISYLQSGVLVSSFFAGNFLGSVLGGMIGDHFGRKQPIVACFGLCLASGCLGAVAKGFWSLALLRFLIGIGPGLGLPPAQAMMTECSPVEWRLAYSTIACMMFPLGEMWTTILMTLDDPEIVNLHWRLLTAAAVFPAAAFLWLAAVFLNQSPLYLARVGRYEEAEEVVTAMRRQNGLPAVPLKLAPERGLSGFTEVTLTRQMQTVFGRRLLLTTCIVCYCCFVAEGIYVAALGGFAKALVKGVELGGSPSVSQFLGTVVELAGYFVISRCAAFPRRVVLCIAFCLQAASLAAFAAGTHFDVQFVAMLGFYVVKLGHPCCLVVLWVYVSEVYPTASRSLGLALTMSTGCIGDVVSPSAVELIVSSAGVDAIFWCAALFHAVAAVLIALLPYETLGQPLPDDDCSEAVNYGAAGDTGPASSASTAVA